MGFFFTDSSSKGKIPHKDLGAILKGVPNLNEKERQYLIGLFDQYEHGHISRNEIDKAVREMRNDVNDGISSDKADRIKKHLVEHLEDEKD